jgi:hypothetical protein
VEQAIANDGEEDDDHWRCRCGDNTYGVLSGDDRALSRSLPTLEQADAIRRD